MKVFISSVTYRLKDERANLPPLLRVVGYDPLRFEDFPAPDASSRAACLAGIDAADTYVLLLGPRYGDPFPDSGMSPTHEEFETARRRGIPILVFVKNTDEPDDPQQADFKRLAGHYVDGRFWKTFDGPMDLNIAVVEALKALPAPGAPLRLQPVTQPPDVPWLHAAGLRPREVDAPVLEIHLLPVPPGGPISATALAAAAKSLARDLRDTGLVPEDQPLTVGSDNHRAWAYRPAETTHHRGNSVVGRTDQAWRGAAVTAAGGATAWLSLPRDMFGTLVSRESLHRDIAAMLSLAAPHGAEAESLAAALRLSPARPIPEGDPSEMGRRNSGTSLGGRDVSIELAPEFAIGAATLRQSVGDLAPRARHSRPQRRAPDPPLLTPAPSLGPPDRWENTVPPAWETPRRRPHRRPD